VDGKVAAKRGQWPPAVVNGLLEMKMEMSSGVLLWLAGSVRWCTDIVYAVRHRKASMVAVKPVVHPYSKLAIM
jgi:hypothetical protein